MTVRPLAASASPLSAFSRDPYRLAISAPAYHIVWTLVVIFHTLQATLLARACYSLVRTLWHPLLVTNVLSATGIAFRPSVTYLSIVCSVVVIAINVLEIARVFLASLRARRLSLAPYTLCDPPPPLAPSLVWPRSIAAAKAMVTRLVHSFHHWRWATSSHGPHFEAAYHAREAFEIALQSAQAFRLSFAVAHDWTNQLAAAVIVLNCWSSPLLYWLFADRAAKRRLSCLAIDVLLDFTSSLVVPYTIYAKYRAYLPQLDMFDPLWVHEASNDIQQFTNLSLFDVLFRLMAAGSMILSLRTSQALLLLREPSWSSAVASGSASTASIVPASSRVVESQLLPPHARVKLFGPSAARLARQPQQPPRGGTWLSVVHVVFVVYGFAVITVYGLASTRHSDRSLQLPGCQLATRQWLAVRYPCAVLEINCHARALEGSRDELTRVLDQVDTRSLSALVLSHCPRLQVPPAILRFPNLVWLELFNATLVEWADDARPLPKTSPHLSRVLLIHVRVTTPTFPRGLLPPDATQHPPALTTIVLVATNATALVPPQLSAHWGTRQVTTLILEDCGLTHVPPTLEGLRVTSLSLANNALKELPAWLLNGNGTTDTAGTAGPYAQFSIAGNPLVALPSDVRHGTTSSIFRPLVAARAAFKGVFLERTNLSQLPPWALAAGLCTSVDVFAFGSPLCAAGGTLASAMATEIKIESETTAGTCQRAATHCLPPPPAALVPVRDIGRLFPLARHETRRRP